MNRQEFLERLRILLGDLSEEEREEAVQYYEDYFADAGPEMEEQVIKELGSPEKVALMIREGVRGEDAGDTYAENGFFQSRYDDREVPADYTTSSGYTGKEESYRGYGDGQPERRPWTSRTLKSILIILIICVGLRSGDGSGRCYSNVFINFSRVPRLRNRASSAFSRNSAYRVQRQTLLRHGSGYFPGVDRSHKEAVLQRKGARIV